MTALPQTAEAYCYDQPENHWSLASAARVVPLLLDMFAPKSVVDVGCGSGIWLAEFYRAGLTDITGIDGAWIQPEHLLVPRPCFLAGDLTHPKEAVSQLGRRYDLVLSLEVAEHLPPDRAQEFVAALVSLGDLICFSAAIPGQGGYEHLNEQWQSYWAKIFAEFGYQAYDIVRPRIRGDHHVQWYYRQNIVIYASDNGAERCLAVCPKTIGLVTEPEGLDYVLAEHHSEKTNPKNYSAREVMRVLPHLIWRTVRARFLPTRPGSS